MQDVVTSKSYLGELRQRVEVPLLVLLHGPEEVVLHLEAVVLELGVLGLELAHQLLVLLHLLGGVVSAGGPVGPVQHPADPPTNND